MEVKASSIRLVGPPRLPGRKMSGLGIDFSDATLPDSPLHHWETDLHIKHSFAFDDTTQRPSRWSESTQQSRAVKTASSSDNSIIASESENSGRRRQSSFVSEVLPCPTTITISRKPSETEAQSYITYSRLYQRSARGSDDSQNSYGPITPADETGPVPRLTNDTGFPGFGESPRKAPAPPADADQVNLSLASVVTRRSSLTHSMLRTLGGRKKDTRPPPPLLLVPNGSPAPVKFEVGPITHHIDRPLARRRESTTGSCIAMSPALAGSSSDVYQRPQSSGGQVPSRGSFGTLLRSVRKSISRRASKASPLIESQGRIQVTKVPTPSTKSNAPSFVNVQVETFLEVRSTPPSPCIDRKAALRIISPDSQAAVASSRPQTAPAGGRNEKATHTFKLHVPPFSQKYTPSASTYSSPVAGQETQLGGFQIQYTDPWKTSSAFKPSSDYSSAQRKPPSPPSWLSPRDSQTPTSDNEDGLQARGKHRLVVPKQASNKSHSMGTSVSSSSFSSTSPTSVPSWTPMVALPSPNVSILQTPPTSFLDLETSPPPFAQSSRNETRSSKIQVEPRKRTNAAPFNPAVLLTPGRVSMRDPWAVVDRSHESSPGEKNGSEGETSYSKVGKAGGDQPSASPAHSSVSPSMKPALQQRRPSRKAVPKIDEEGVLLPMTDDEDSRIYTGCRPFHRPSVDQQLSDMTITKIPFGTRASLSNVREGYVDEHIRSIPRSLSLAGRGASISSAAGEEWYDRVGRPSYPTFENTYYSRRPSYASEMSNQSFPSKPTRLDFRRPTLGQSEGIRVSFDSGVML